MARIICWFSCGAASAVATKLALQKYGHERVVVVYCDTGSEHPDNARFMADCARWFNAPIQTIRSADYADTWAVFEKRRFLSGPKGAPCTLELKIKPRLDFQRPDDIQVFGYTADKSDVTRAKNFRKNFFEVALETPLIDAGLDKAACLALIENAGIALPPIYAMGFPNNNCLPCVKATSPDYWALMRKRFPEKFERMAALSRSLGARLSRISDERIFIDEIPADWPTLNPIAPACDFLCHLIEQDMSDTYVTTPQNAVTSGQETQGEKHAVNRLSRRINRQA